MAAGWEVEIAAIGTDGLPVEEVEDAVRLHRYRPTGRWGAWAGRRSSASSSSRAVRVVRLTLERTTKLVFWPVHVRAWWAALHRELPPADLYHAFGILTIPVALQLGAAARGAGRAGRVVYDVIDVILESNNVARVPRPALVIYRWRERRWARRADAVLTVNDALARHLRRVWPMAPPALVLLNCQPRWDPPDPPPNLIRAATGLPAERRIVLFLGRLGRERGLAEAADAVLAVDDAALVLLGFGPWADRLHARDHDPRYEGRHVTLPAVHPDEVPAWTASADVSIIAVPANSLNQRLSTPNKFWESLTAGTPMVVGQDLEVMRDIVEADDLGAVADPSDPTDLARALSRLLDAPPAERAARRARCLRLARERYSWERAVAPYLELTERLVPAVAGSAEGGRG